MARCAGRLPGDHGRIGPRLESPVMIDMDDQIIRHARNNRLLLRLTWLAIFVLSLLNADYILERL